MWGDAGGHPDPKRPARPKLAALEKLPPGAEVTARCGSPAARPASLRPSVRPSIPPSLPQRARAAAPQPPAPPAALLFKINDTQVAGFLPTPPSFPAPLGSRPRSGPVPAGGRGKFRGGGRGWGGRSSRRGAGVGAVQECGAGCHVKRPLAARGDMCEGRRRGGVK